MMDLPRSALVRRGGKESLTGRPRFLGASITQGGESCCNIPGSRNLAMLKNTELREAALG
jgi:hypothetical protein